MTKQQRLAGMIDDYIHAANVVWDADRQYREVLAESQRPPECDGGWTNAPDADDAPRESPEWFEQIRAEAIADFRRLFDDIRGMADVLDDLDGVVRADVLGDAELMLKAWGNPSYLELWNAPFDFQKVIPLQESLRRHAAKIRNAALRQSAERQAHPRSAKAVARQLVEKAMGAAFAAKPDHAHVLLQIAQSPDLPTREIARITGKAESTVRGIRKRYGM